MRGCCGRNIRQGVFLVTVIQMAAIVMNFTLVLYFYTNPTSFYYVNMLKEIIADQWAYIALLTSGLTLSLGLAMVVLPPSSGLSGPMKLYAALSVLGGIAWILYGFMLGRQLSTFFFTYLPSTGIIKSGVAGSMRARTGFWKGVHIGKVVFGATVGAAIDDAAIDLLRAMLGSPLDWLLDIAMNPILPVAILGLPLTVAALAAVGVILAYADILAMGGDGTEFVGADEIEWFYKLSKSKQHKVRDQEGSLTEESDSDDDDDEEEDEEAQVPLKKAAPSVEANEASPTPKGRKAKRPQ